MFSEVVDNYLGICFTIRSIVKHIPGSILPDKNHIHNQNLYPFKKYNFIYRKDLCTKYTRNHIHNQNLYPFKKYNFIHRKGLCTKYTRNHIHNQKLYLF